MSLESNRNGLQNSLEGVGIEGDWVWGEEEDHNQSLTTTLTRI